MGVAVQDLDGLAPNHPDRATGHRRVLASPSVRTPLAVALATSARWSTGGRARHLRSHPPDAPSQSAVGRPTHSWRIVQIGSRGLPNDGGKICRASTHATISDVAQVPDRARVAARVDRFLHRPNGHVSRAVCADRAVAHAPARGRGSKSEKPFLRTAHRPICYEIGTASTDQTSATC